MIAKTIRRIREGVVPSLSEVVADLGTPKSVHFPVGVLTSVVVLVDGSAVEASTIGDVNRQSAPAAVRRTRPPARLNR